MKIRLVLVGLNVLMMVANFALWVAQGAIFNFLVALLCGAVAIYLVWRGNR